MRRLIRAGAVAAVLFGLGFGYARLWWGPGPEALERQRREVLRLGGQLDERLRERAWLRDRAGENVVVGIPAAVAERVAGEAMTGLASGIDLTLRDLRFRKADEVQARLLLGRRTVGRFVLSVHVRELRAVLRPRTPRLRFADGRVGLSLPVSVEDGEGRARLRFTWDGRGVAGAVCGDLDVTRDITATVPRHTHTLEGGLRLSVQGTALVAQPEIGDVPLRVPIEPSPAAWRVVDDLIASRSALCRAALARVDVHGRIRGLLGRGIPVTVPRRVLERPLRLPLAVERSVSVGDRELRLDARPSDVSVGPARLWYGVQVEVGETGPVQSAHEPGR
jgi:hypothetical protein